MGGQILFRALLWFGHPTIENVVYKLYYVAVVNKTETETETSSSSSARASPYKTTTAPNHPDNSFREFRKLFAKIADESTYM